MINLCEWCLEPTTDLEEELEIIEHNGYHAKCEHAAMREMTREKIRTDMREGNE